MDELEQDQIVRSRDEILHALEQFPSELRRLILDPADKEALLKPAFNGGWGVVEILPHLKDWELIYLDRIEAILTEDLPSLPGYDDTLWSIERDYRGQDPYDTFAEFAELRGQLVQRLKSAESGEWERVGVHGYYGEITLHWLGNHICDHDVEHLQQAKDAMTA